MSDMKLERAWGMPNKNTFDIYPIKNMKYGFEIEKILLVAHGGWHNDTICTIERKIRNI